MEKKLTSIEVFTPTTPAKVTFIERNRINDRLVNALQTPGKQIIVYGHSGTGKTTLLSNKLLQLYEFHVTTRCTTETKVEDLIINAFDQLQPFYESESTSESGSSISAGIKTDYKVIKTAIQSSITEKTSVKRERVLPPQLTPGNLAKFMGIAKACWVLEDFHKVAENEKKLLSNTMKIFVDSAEEFPEVKIIAIGAADTAEQIVECDTELRTRVSEIEVNLMSASELAAIIGKGESLLNINIHRIVKEEIIRFSNGLAAVCHQICLNMCQTSGIVQTQDEKYYLNNSHLKQAIDLYIEDSSATLKKAFEIAYKQRKGKYDNARLIILALASFDPDGATHNELLAKIKKKEPKYPTGNLSHYLKALQEASHGEIIRSNQNSGKFYFTEPLYRTFVLAELKKKEKHSKLVIPDSRNVVEAQLVASLVAKIAKNML